MAALSDISTARTAPAPVVVAVGGPTATGKTALSVRLARRFGGEIVSADSMQLYKGLSVGTAKATPEEQAGIPHHLLDLLSPQQTFSVAEYTALAGAAIEGITARGRLPIVAGGTGLYITSLLNGVRFLPQQADPAYRQALERRAAAGEGDALYAELRQTDPAAAAGIHPHNLPRVIRALEICHLAGDHAATAQRAASRPAAPPYRSLCLCLTCRDRAVLYRRIDERVARMMANGLLDEAAWVWQNRDACRTAAQAIGYKEFFPYFAGTAPLQDCVAALQQASRRYAKRQLTWFRNQGGAVWLYLDEEDVGAKAEALTEAFLLDHE